jgi:hypothetical protein
LEEKIKSCSLVFTGEISPKRKKKKEKNPKMN